MPLELVTVPCRSDNYAYLLHDSDSGDTALVDAPETAPIQTALDSRRWRLTDILLTHHHDDHTAAVADLRQGCRVIGAAADAHRLPPLDLQVADGETFFVCGKEAQVFDVSGHTIGHIAFHIPAMAVAFTADSLMAMGCGRLFEGTAKQMWGSMCKLRALPPETTICSGHEYTLTNARFAASLEPDNPKVISRFKAVSAARERDEATVPSSLAEEIATNPFLRADDPALAKAIDMEGATPVAVFAEIRSRKDRF